MQSLLRSLQDQDLGHLRILAELWGLDLPRGSAQEAMIALAENMLDPELATEVIRGLPRDALATLEIVLQEGGRMPLVDLVRRVGPLRQMGPGRRDREKPWRDPLSPVELLWYHGLLARAFADSPAGPQEFAFIPTDLRPFLPQPDSPNPLPLGRAALQPPSQPRLASSAAADDATTLLAAVRGAGLGTTPTPDQFENVAPFLLQPASLELILTLLTEDGILHGSPLQLDLTAARSFLDSARPEALRRLILAWQDSRQWNDLAQIPGLESATEGWPNDPLTTRRNVLSLLHSIPAGTWWDLESFIAAVLEHEPAFQRPVGDFESWYLRDAESGAFLRGFEHWNRVDGELLRFLITGPMHWLGGTDVGAFEGQGRLNAFRITPFGATLFDSRPKAISEPAAPPSILRSDGWITVPRHASRSLRYQIARITRWAPLTDDTYHYQLTASSLHAARNAGLEIKHILNVLEGLAQAPIPPTLARALRRWYTEGTEARIERPFVLRVENEAVLEELERNHSTARYIKERLGPCTVAIDRQDLDRFSAAATRLGILVDNPSAADQDP